MNAPDQSEKPFRVDAGGEIRLPMIGRVQRLADFTVDQLETEIAKPLEQAYVVEPEVTIGITFLNSGSQPVSIVGAVAARSASTGRPENTGRNAGDRWRRPARCRPYGEAMTLPPRIPGRIAPCRAREDDPTHQYSIAEVNLKSVMEARNPEFNIPIRPHDVISVPHAEVVYVIGGVNRAGALPLNEGDSLSVLEAVSSSGGMYSVPPPCSHARHNLRPVPGQCKRTELPVDLKKIMAGQSEDMLLLAGDVLVVPGSNSKHAIYRALEAAVTMRAPW